MSFIKTDKFEEELSLGRIDFTNDQFKFALLNREAFNDISSFNTSIPKIEYWSDVSAYETTAVSGYETLGKNIELGSLSYEHTDKINIHATKVSFINATFDLTGGIIYRESDGLLVAGVATFSSKDIMETYSLENAVFSISINVI